MRVGFFRTVVLTSALLFLWEAEARAQARSQVPSSPQPKRQAEQVFPRFETGIVFTALRLPQPIGEGAGGVGGRFGYNLSRYTGIEAEINHFPGGTRQAPNFGETQVLLGVKLGYADRDGGLFVKARPGLVHFPENGALHGRGLAQLNHFTLDLGVVGERYFSNHTYIRFDFGDTIISYGNAQILNPLTGTISRPGTVHNPQLSFGVGAHF